MIKPGAASDLYVPLTTQERILLSLRAMADSRDNGRAYAPPTLQWVTDIHGTMTHANNLLCMALRRRRGSMLGMRSLECVRPGEDPRITCPEVFEIAAWTQAHPGQKRRWESYLVASDGHHVDVWGYTYFNTIGEGSWVAEVEISEAEYARIRAAHPGAQFLDYYDHVEFDEFLRDREELRLRQQISAVVQQELFELNNADLYVPKPATKSRVRPPHNIPPLDFEKRLRDVLREVNDPDKFLGGPLIKNVRPRILLSRNALWDYLNDYGYVRDNETLSVTLKRISREWFPEWCNN